MIKLNEYLGSIVSSIVEARVLADTQSIMVAEEYSRHKLMEHFTVPRMRIEDIEITIPVAIEGTGQKNQEVYGIIDSKKFSSIAYKEILSTFGIEKMSLGVSRSLKRELSEQINLLETKLRVKLDYKEITLFSRNIASFVIKLREELFKQNKKLSTQTKRFPNLKNEIAVNLEKRLKEEIKVESEKSGIDLIEVTTESDKLREKKAESLVYIKMRITEDGMEWNKMENSEGEVVRALLPE